jgi:hypothetical protein
LCPVTDLVARAGAAAHELRAPRYAAAQDPGLLIAEVAMDVQADEPQADPPDLRL